MKKLKEIELPEEIIEWELSGRVCPGGVSPTEHFIKCISAGSTVKFAIQLVALGCGESTMGVGITDSVMNQDQNRHGSSLRDRFHGNEIHLKALQAAARRHGYSLKHSDHYNPCVTDYFGDPIGFMNRDDMKRELQRRGKKLTSDGVVVRTEPQKESRVHKLHPRIVRELACADMAEKGITAPTKKQIERAKEKVISEHSYGG